MTAKKSAPHNSLSSFCPTVKERLLKRYFECKLAMAEQCAWVTMSHFFKCWNTWIESLNDSSQRASHATKNYLSTLLYNHGGNLWNSLHFSLSSLTSEHLRVSPAVIVGRNFFVSSNGRWLPIIRRLAGPRVTVVRKCNALSAEEIVARRGEKTRDRAELAIL